MKQMLKPPPQKGYTDLSTLSKSQPMIGSYPHNRMNSTSRNTVVTSNHTQQMPYYQLSTPTIHLKSYHRIQYWWKLNSTKPMTGTTSNPSCPNLRPSLSREFVCVILGMIYCTSNCTSNRAKTSSKTRYHFRGFCTISWYDLRYDSWVIYFYFFLW